MSLYLLGTGGAGPARGVSACRPFRDVAAEWLAHENPQNPSSVILSFQDMLTLINVLPPSSERVASPPEPMALRLSSQLMYGVVRVYVQQVSVPRFLSGPLSLLTSPLT